jgi:adenylate cyclase
VNPSLRKFLERLASASLVAAAILLISGTSLFRFVDRKTIDYRFTIRDSLRKPEPKSPVIIVTIDGKTLDRYPDPADLNDAMMRGIEILSGARAIGFDVLHLSAMDPGRCNYDKGIFLKTIVNSKRLVVPYYMMKNDLSMPVYVAELMAEIMGLDGKEISHFPQKAKFKLLDASEKILPVRFGYANLSSDGDGVIREIKLAEKFGDMVMPAFPLAIYMRYEGIEASGVFESPDGLRAGKKLIPQTGSRMAINYAAPPGRFPHVSLADVIGRRGDAGFLKRNFRGRIVLIGAYDLRIPDFHPTPYYASSLGRTENMFGVEIVANALDTIVTGNFIRSEPAWMKTAAVFISCILAVFLLVRPPLWCSLPLLAALMACWAAAGQYAFTRYAFMLDVVSVSAALPLAFLVGHLHNTFILDRDKRFIQRVLGSYLDHRIVKELSSRSDLSLLRGRRKEITVLFSDIRGFTTMSEKLSPEQVVEILNIHLSAMSDIIIRSGGMVDKYIGDCIMAVWNAPNDVGNHRRLACETALRMLDALKDVNRVISEKGIKLAAELKIGIGLNTGYAIVGNIGSELKSDYTAIGDTVNVASRLESLNKQFGTGIIVSESTVEGIRDVFTVRDLGAIPVKGRAEPVQIYELIAVNKSA